MGLNWVQWIVVGFIGGFIGSRIARQGGQGILRDILLGIVGGVIGGWLFRQLGDDITAAAAAGLGTIEVTPILVRCPVVDFANLR